MNLIPIGTVRSSLRDPSEAPRQGREGAPAAWLEIDPAYQDGNYKEQPRDGMRRGFMGTYLWYFGTAFYDVDGVEQELVFGGRYLDDHARRRVRCAGRLQRAHAQVHRTDLAVVVVVVVVNTAASAGELSTTVSDTGTPWLVLNERVVVLVRTNWPSVPPSGSVS